MLFEWEVPVSGFQWVGDHPQPPKGYQPNRWDEKAIGPTLVANQGWQKRRYSPVETPALFRIFAFTPQTEEGILAFANQYGAPFDRFWTWVATISELRFTIELWDALQAHDEDKLRQVMEMRWNKTDKLWMAKFNVPFCTRWDMAYERRQDSGFVRFADGEDYWHAALSFIHDTVDRSLGNIESHMIYSSSTDTLSFALLPHSFESALWLQFALSINGGTDFRRCPSCNTWFELSPDVNRKSRHYCSDACRSRAYRSRKACRDT